VNQFLVLKVGIVLLILVSPQHIVGEDDGRIGTEHGVLERLCGFAEIGAGIADFAVPSARNSVMVEYAVPVFLRAGKARSPAVVNDSFGAVGKGLHCPKTKLSRLRGIADCAPATGSAFLFHHPEAFLLEAARQGMAHRNPAEQLVSECGNGIIVPGGKIHLPAEAKIINMLGVRHHVGRNRFSSVCTEDFRLHTVIIQNAVRAETFVIKLQPGVVNGIVHVADSAGRISGKNQLVPAAVSLAPENGSPFAVEILQRSVLVLQPADKRLPAIFTPAATHQLVIHLPRDHMRIFTVVRGHCGNNPPGVFPKRRAVEAGMPPAAEAPHPAVKIGGAHIGAFVHQPFWRCGGRRAQNSINSEAGQCFNRPIQPFKMELTLLRFQLCPRKLAHANRIKARIPH